MNENVMVVRCSTGQPHTIIRTDGDDLSHMSEVVNTHDRFCHGCGPHHAELAAPEPRPGWLPRARRSLSMTQLRGLFKWPTGPAE